MKFSLYLLDKSKVNNFSQILKNRHGYREITEELKVFNNFQYKLFYKNPSAPAPSRLNFINQAISGEGIHLNKKTASGVVLIKVVIENEDIYFALCFGAAFHIIDMNKIVRDFGLKTALNTIPYEKIMVVDGRTLGPNVKETRAVFSKSTSFDAFGLDEMEQLLTFIEGRTIDEQLGTKLSGRESLSFNMNLKTFDFEKLGQQCIKYYNKYIQTTYQTRFGFIDNCVPEKDSSITSFLEEELVKYIEDTTHDFSQISISLPNMIDSLSISEFKLLGTTHIFDELNEEIIIPLIRVELLKFRRMTDKIEKIKKMRIIGSDGDEEKTGRMRMFDLISFQIEIPGEERISVYVLNNGKRYIVSTGFVNDINSRISEIPFVTPADQGYTYPKFDGSIHTETRNINGRAKICKSEGEYNKALSNSIGGLLLDKNNFLEYLPGHSQVEACDILVGQAFYHIKRGCKSSTLSHLFNQAFVSLELLRKFPEYVAFINQHGGTVNGTQEVDVILGLIENGEIKNKIPFFSRVTLVNLYRNMKSMNGNLKVLQIEKINC